MKNILIIENQAVALESNVDDGTNRLFINGNEIPYNSWVGSGTYTYNSVVIHKVNSSALSGNLVLKEVANKEYAFTNSAPFKELTFDDVYPVGSIYLSVNNVNPSTLFGGTWEQIKDKFLLAAGNTYSNGDTGGEATHTLTVNEIPSHNHYVGNSENGKFWFVGKPGPIAPESSQGIPNISSNGRVTTFETDYKGGGQPHNNMPPYLAVTIWKRTA